MAALPQASLTLDGKHSSPEITLRELSILLSRLKQVILHPTQEDERRLRTSQYERIRVETNLRFAQSALNTLERQSLAGRLVGKRSETLADLAAQREVLELLLDRLEDYNQLATDHDDEDSSEEDLLGDGIPTPSEGQGSRRLSDVGKGGARDEERISRPAMEHEPAAVRPTAADPAHEPKQAGFATIENDPTQTTHDMRARGTAPTTEHAHSTARALLFANRRPQTTTATTAATAEAILDQQRVEQEVILDSIRKMAGALKQSSQTFSASLESDKDRLDAAGASMEKSGLSMDAAQGRMGSLKRMTEGEGWWGRMMLYLWVYGLMVVLLVVVFVLPKLRF